MEEMEQEAPEQAAGGATKLVQQVGEGLGKLAQMLDGSQGVTEQDRGMMAQIMSLFTELVEKKLGGSAPGEDRPPEELPADQGAVPAMGGAKGVPMGPQARM
jgi:hypothetical protein